MPKFAGDGSYNYKYNGQEWQDELGLNMTAMDFRQYDSAIGRFFDVDPFVELSYSMTPYKFAYNNPIYWNDPLGLFETKDEAKQYAKEHGIRTGWFSRNKIQEGANGTWAINNAKEGTSIFATNASDAADLGVDVGDVVTGVVVQAESKSKSSEGSSFGWMTIWGNYRSGDTSGLKGTTTHSLESSDFVTPNDSRSLNNKGASFWKWLISYIKNSIDTYQQAITIQEEVGKNSNTSTMEVQKKEPVIITNSIKIVEYTFHLNDSTVTKNTQTNTFKGEASAVKRKIDSVQRINDSRTSAKNSWLKSWGK
jgi:RHS repeat-associated protein